MGDPLSPLAPSHLNRNTPSSIDRRQSNYPNAKSPAPTPAVPKENRNLTSPSTGPPSSPFVEDVSLPPSKLLRPSPTKLRRPPKARSDEVRPLTEDALRSNDLAGSTRSLDEASIDPSSKHAKGDDTISTMAGWQGFASMDDTCFSAFSAVPNADMTRFANLGQSPTEKRAVSPTKSHGEERRTPCPASRNTPSRRRNYQDENASPTPRRQKPNHSDDDTTNLLMDFTDQITISQSHLRPAHNHSPFKPNSHHNLSSYASSRRTPSPAKQALPLGTPCEARHLANLLDFDLTPAPTPRSIPSITARELESMKSAFLSQISSLTATLSGREAEVKALSTAVADAERRVGEALEQIRDERGAKESLQAEKEGFENRQREMQKVLKDVKEEIMASDREKDSLLQRMQEAEHQRETAEARAVEAESKLEGMKSRSPMLSTQRSESSNSTNAEVEAAVNKVAKELHSLYKSKHEGKVTALKKSYSDRWERKVKELQVKVGELSKENEELRVSGDATMSGVVSGKSLTDGNNDPQAQTGEQDAQQKAYEQQKQKLQFVKSELVQTQKDLSSAKDENKTLQVQLTASRAATEDLIAATEELMRLSQTANASTLGTFEAPAGPSGTTSQDIKSSLSRSISGPSGLKAPGFGGGSFAGESRIGKVGGGGGSFQRDRSGSGYGSRSGIMSNIERMGRGRVVD